MKFNELRDTANVMIGVSNPSISSAALIYFGYLKNQIPVLNYDDIKSPKQYLPLNSGLIEATFQKSELLRGPLGFLKVA